MNPPIEIPRPPSAPPMAPAKQRVLESAAVLFYQDGIHAVGVDRLIASSKVTKATFYKHFGSKDRLIIEYIENRHRRAAEDIITIAASTEDAESVLHAIRDDIETQIETPGFHGCAFLNAATEFGDPRHPVRQRVAEHRDWYLGVLETLLRRLGHPLPGDAADDLMLARDGAMSGGYAGDPIAAATALARAFDRIIGEARR